MTDSLISLDGVTATIQLNKRVFEPPQDRWTLNVAERSTFFRPEYVPANRRACEKKEWKQVLE